MGVGVGVGVGKGSGVIVGIGLGVLVEKSCSPRIPDMDRMTEMTAMISRRAKPKKMTYVFLFIRELILEVLICVNRLFTREWQPVSSLSLFVPETHTIISAKLFVRNETLRQICLQKQIQQSILLNGAEYARPVVSLLTVALVLSKSLPLLAMALCG
mgnify:CR=1 FL=1